MEEPARQQDLEKVLCNLFAYGQAGERQKISAFVSESPKMDATHCEASDIPRPLTQNSTATALCARHPSFPPIKNSGNPGASVVVLLDLCGMCRYRLRKTPCGHDINDDNSRFARERRVEKTSAGGRAALDRRAYIRLPQPQSRSKSASVRRSTLRHP